MIKPFFAVIVAGNEIIADQADLFYLVTILPVLTFFSLVAIIIAEIGIII